MSYKAEIIADSLSPQGKRLTTFVVTYPRIVHAEMCRHRMHSRNTASSRAIPFEKMVKEVQENPFIPIAWQKSHKGMQGDKYCTDELEIQFRKNIWLDSKRYAVKCAEQLSEYDTTKQLCNRLLEPFVWVTEIISGTEWDNFFELRCPSYFGKYRSWKDACVVNGSLDWDTPFHLRENKSQADIHIQAIAELMWDEFNSSIPKQLQSGEWHIPFGDKFDMERLHPAHFINLVKDGDKYNEEEYTTHAKVMIATARCARISYLNFEGKDDYEADIKLHDRLMSMKHWSPFEHCAKAMSEDEYYESYNGTDLYSFEQYNKNGEIESYMIECSRDKADKSFGWCRNFQGFIQYRHLIEN